MKNLASLLLNSTTKTQYRKIAEIVIADNKALDEMIALFLGEDYRLNQFIINVLMEVFEMGKIDLTDRFQSDFIAKLNHPKPFDVHKRNLMKFWAETSIPFGLYGEIYDIAFSYLNQPEAIAVKAHAMKVCYRIALEIPELRSELRFALEDQLLKYGNESPGIKSRANRILKLLNKVP